MNTRNLLVTIASLMLFGASHAQMVNRYGKPAVNTNGGSAGTNSGNIQAKTTYSENQRVLSDEELRLLWRIFLSQSEQDEQARKKAVEEFKIQQNQARPTEQYNVRPNVYIRNVRATPDTVSFTMVNPQTGQTVYRQAKVVRR